MATVLAIGILGGSCANLFGPDDESIQLEYRTDHDVYPMTGEVVVELTNVGMEPVRVGSHRLVHQWDGEEWSSGLLIAAPNAAVIMEESFSILGPGDSIIDTIPVSHLRVASAGRFRITRGILSVEKRPRRLVSETNPFTIEQ